MKTTNCPGKFGFRSGVAALLLAAALSGLAPAGPALAADPGPGAGERGADECSAGSIFSQPWSYGGLFYWMSNRENLDGDHTVVLDNFAGLASPICGLQWWGSAKSYHHTCTCMTSPGPGGTDSRPVDASVPQPIRFRLDFHEDGGGVPGALRESRLVSPVAVRAGHDWDGNDSCPYWNPPSCLPPLIENWMYTARLEPCIEMTEGWISIRALISTPATESYWSVASSSMDNVMCQSQGGECTLQSGGLSLCLLGAEAPMPVTIQVWMPSVYYRPGDSFCLTARTTSNLGGPVDCNLCVVLDLHGAYFFYPSWSPPGGMPDSQPVTVQDDNRMLIAPFAWPAGLEPDQGLRFWVACLDPDLSSLVSNLAWIDWGHGS